MPRTVDEGFREFLIKLTTSGYESEASNNHRYFITTRLQRILTTYHVTRIRSFGNGKSIFGNSDIDHLACLPTKRLTENSTYSF